LHIIENSHFKNLKRSGPTGEEASADDATAQKKKRVEEEVCFEMGEMVYKKLPILVSGIIDIIPTVLYCTVYFTLTPLTVKLTSPFL
jgi:hypothetical protein